MPKFVFFVSGHGYGHARRMTQVIRCLRELQPHAEVVIRSAAPARVFEPLPSNWVQFSEIDAGLIEVDPFTIDTPKSLAQLRDVIGKRGRIIAAEAQELSRIKPDCIVADVPFLAGDAAAQAGLPCVGVSNFTWDWIYHGLFGNDPAWLEIAPIIESSYSKFRALLALPFGNTCPLIKNTIPTPLVALRSDRDPADVLRQLGIAASDSRPRVLIGTRGLLPPTALAQAAADASECLFLCPNESATNIPSNAVAAPIGPGLDFSDVLGVADVVVSKLGYSLVAECIATQTPLVWPPRSGFVEDQIMAEQAPDVLRMTPMPIADYRAGRWGKWIRAALALQAPPRAMAAKGAEVVAEWLVRN